MRLRVWNINFCTILADPQDTGTPLIKLNRKAAGTVDLSAATTETRVDSGNIQGGPGSRMLQITRGNAQTPGSLTTTYMDRALEY